jgi:hypothetical protein
MGQSDKINKTTNAPGINKDLDVSSVEQQCVEELKETVTLAFVFTLQW